MRRLIVLAVAVSALASGTAHAVPLRQYPKIFGSYAKGGNCAASPRVVIAATGVTLVVGQKSRAFPKAEVALGFNGPDDQTLTLLVNGQGDGLAITIQDEPHPNVIGLFGGAPWTAEEKAAAAVPEMRRCKVAAK